VLSGIRRRFGARQEAKAAILTPELRRMVRALPATLAGVRDAAMLLVGFAGAFRRSELAALDREDLDFGDLGLILAIRRSKTDQAGIGRKTRAVAPDLEIAPVAAVCPSGCGCSRVLRKCRGPLAELLEVRNKGLVSNSP
jgi:integrase